MNTERKYNEYYDGEGLAFGEAPSPELSLLLKRKPHRGKALDLGAGDGRNSLYLAQLGFLVTAVDVSEVGLDKLKRAARERKVEDKIETLEADVRKLSLPRKEFDLIVAETVFDHIPAEEIESLFQRTAGWLRRSGSVYIKVHTVDDPGNNNDKRVASELSSMVKYYFKRNELLSMVLNRLHITWYSEQGETDTTHGKVHQHVFAKIWAQDEPLLDEESGSAAGKST